MMMMMREARDEMRRTWHGDESEGRGVERCGWLWR